MEQSDLEDVTAEPAEKQDNFDLIGSAITIDNRRYVIESIGEISGDVSMRDITFQNDAGFPINRVEKLSRVREWLNAQQEAIYFRGCYDSAEYLKKAGIL